MDAIQEFSTEVANPSAAYGGRSGAQTIITTKTGTNTFHGAAFEYNRTAATEANTFFNNQADVPRLALVRNQWGADIGGPVLKDKLFFFFEYDGRRDASAQSVLEIVPFPHVDKGELAYINDSGGGVPKHEPVDFRRREHELRDDSLRSAGRGARSLLRWVPGCAGIRGSGRGSCSLEFVQYALSRPERLLPGGWC